MTKAPKGTRKTPEAKEVEDAVVVDVTAPEPSESEASEPEPSSAGPTAEGAGAREPDRAPAPEPEVSREPEPGPTADKRVAPAPPPPAKRRGGAGVFVGLVSGGLLAAIVGFAAARYVVPEGWPFPGVAPKEDPLATAVAAQAGELAALSNRVTDLDSRLAAREADKSSAIANDELNRQINALTQQFGAASARLDELSSRLDAVEKMAPEGSAAAQAAADAYARELANLREMFSGELAKVEAAQADAAKLEADAASAAKDAAGRAALSRVMAALDTGQPFEAPLAELTDATGIAAPGVLTALAKEGVPTLAQLQAGFAPVARAALDASIRAAVDDGSMNRFTAFLRTQLGTRSLEPRAGDDPDAVLSRAEDDLRNGRIAGALTELDTLPDAAKPLLVDWRAEAQKRLDALTAGAQLADQLK